MLCVQSDRLAGFLACLYSPGQRLIVERPKQSQPDDEDIPLLCHRVCAIFKCLFRGVSPNPLYSWK